MKATVDFHLNQDYQNAQPNNNLIASREKAIILETDRCPRCGLYSDGRWGGEPQSNGIIYEPTFTTSWFLSLGFKTYYNKDFTKYIWTPLNPRTDESYKASFTSSKSDNIGWKNGYSDGFGWPGPVDYGLAPSSLDVRIAIGFVAGISGVTEADYYDGYILGFLSGREDSNNDYRNYLENLKIK